MASDPDVPYEERHPFEPSGAYDAGYEVCAECDLTRAHDMHKKPTPPARPIIPDSLPPWLTHPERYGYVPPLPPELRR